MEKDEICSTRGLQNTMSWIVCFCMFLYEFSQSTDLDKNHSQPTNNLAHELTGITTNGDALQPVVVDAEMSRVTC